jgi:hypothetical protein
MFIAKGELQTFTDSSALAAVRWLDGTQTGVQNAHSTAVAGPLGSTVPNKINFDSELVDAANITDTYARSFTDNYQNYNSASGPPTNSWMFIKVTASATARTYFMQVIPGVASQMTVNALSIAGYRETDYNYAGGGLEPFAPAAHDVHDVANFGFTPGVQYSLKWGNCNNNNCETTCAGDLGWDPGWGSSEHGFVDVGQGTNSNSTLQQVITYGGYPNPTSDPSTIVPGQDLVGIPGNRGSGVFDALAARSLQDPDQTSLTWEQYKASKTGNYRRVVTAAVSDPAYSSGTGSNATFRIIGFGNFLIDPAATISGSNGPICATYIGLASTTGFGPAGAHGDKTYEVMLFR